MEIDNIAKQIFSEKPKPKFSICLNLDINSSINEQFEIISLMFFRGVNDLIITQEYNDNNDIKELKSYLLKKLLLLKIYFGSFGINLNYENVPKKDYKNFKMCNRPSYYTENKYNFDFVILKKFYYKGKNKILYYNHNKKEDNIKNMFIIIKFRNHYFKFSFNLLEK
ncbi:uncharacterized protein METZ01_LOCUS3599 [marine metagenome]|jgi:hypothetical protein|uniref:Uncharacterized protein n=1 Tax=marine metagenome TaxID=408172 RepID=A0A381N8A5_9ZZZZ